MDKITYRDPLFIQIREVIRSKIDSGEFLPGIAIPSEMELADKYGVSRLTIRTAIDALVYEGMLRRVQGKGVYVSEQKINYNPEAFGGFKQNINGKNIHFSTKVIYTTIRKAEPFLAHILNVKQDEDIFYLKRLCYADDIPFMLNKLYVPKNLLPNLDEVDLSIFQPYEIYSMNGLAIQTIEQKLDLVYLHDTDSSRLGIEPLTAVMAFECISHLENGTVIEYSKSYTRGDICNFTIDFH